jgi:hypothetical protein
MRVHVRADDATKRGGGSRDTGSPAETKMTSVAECPVRVVMSTMHRMLEARENACSANLFSRQCGELAVHLGNVR